MRISPVLPLLFLMSGILTACDHNIDGIARLNEIPFGGTNDVNIAAMVANPADLVRGRGETAVSGKSADAPIQRLDTDHAKTLLNSGQASTSSGGASGG
ncbi:MAG TPA: hypothetical protein DDZ81_09485 [Acetobacteraceae bacterium]|jgi:type IV pilus biogenesis protein CpaD/CtpE|nr:hypothetical protein [Acetobacteraceae bacterium]